MKHLLLVIVVVAVGWLSADVQNEYFKPEDIPQEVFQQLSGFIPADKPVFLQVDAGEFTAPLRIRLKEYLIRQQYIVVSTPNENSATCEISYNSVSQVKGSRGLLTDSRYLRNKHTFNLEIRFHQQITAFHSLKLYTRNPVNAEGEFRMHWYDPVVILTVIGGLIYLFYYGGN
ncbi:MAG: hypothetical protein K8S56_08620 [Candidatus Cloacimonetes bacterium]|nr:hypothetical protein [Candidatus Cloacimonadota bacterium]